MRTMDQAAFSKAEQDASFRLQMDITSSLSIDHFRITFGLFFKASPGAHLFI